jgi:GxxExxY protein
VHKYFGPGLLESVYEECLINELRHSGLDVKPQLEIPLEYKGKRLNSNLRIDVLVNDLIVIEIKAVEKVLPVHKAQLLSYLKLTNKPKGLLINFNCETIVNDLVPLVTEEFSKLLKE